MLLPPNDHARLTIIQILRERHISGMVQWREQPRREMLAVEISPEDVNDALFKYVDEGGEINAVPEKRPEFSAFEVFYEFRIMVLEREVYLETRINDHSRRNPPFLWIVSAHEGWWK